MENRARTMRFRPERALECRVGERCPIPKTSSAMPPRAARSSDGSSIRRSATNCFKELTPRYGKVVADHVTLAANVDRDTPLPEAVTAEAIGHIDDDRGVEALVVAIAGSTARHPRSRMTSLLSIACRPAASSIDQVE